MLRGAGSSWTHEVQGRLSFGVGLDLRHGKCAVLCSVSRANGQERYGNGRNESLCYKSFRSILKKSPKTCWLVKMLPGSSTMLDGPLFVSSVPEFVVPASFPLLYITLP